MRKTFKEHVGVLRDKYGLVIDEQVMSSGCALHDMAATDNYYLGESNVLLVGEAGGFNRCGEGITSALITGKAAGQSILKSIDSGRPAMEFYPGEVAPEREACSKVNRVIEEIVGVNPFTRE